MVFLANKNFYPSALLGLQGFSSKVYNFLCVNTVESPWHRSGVRFGAIKFWKKALSYRKLIGIENKMLMRKLGSAGGWYVFLK